MSMSRVISRPNADRVGRAGILVLVLAFAAVALAFLPAAPASATWSSGSSTPFACAADKVYSIDGESHVITRITPSTGATASNGTIDAGDDTLNALALPANGGRYIYAYNRSKNEVIRFDANTNGEQSYSLAANSSAGSVIAGAINPVNGLYYYAVGGDTWSLYAFNTSTNTGLGRVATIKGLGGNGDMAFDALGNLYVVSNDNSADAGTLARVNAPLPTTAGSTALTSTSLATLPSNKGQYAAMAFDGSGYLFIGTGSGALLKVNPTSGNLEWSKTLSLDLHDMASCSSPSTATTRVNLPDGRHDGADQFKVTITGSGVSTGNTGTTSGADSGLQTDAVEMAGPVVVLPGTTYTITQSAAGGTDLNDYATTWACIDQNDGTQIASGSGNSGSFKVPSTSGASVICTFTDIPLHPAVTLVKSAGAINDLDGNGPDAGDTVTYTFKVTNSGNIALSSVGVTDSKLTGSITCGATSLAVGASTTCGPKSYALTQGDVDAGRVDNTATATGKGSNGVVVTDTDSATVTVPVRPALVLDKTASAIVNGKITYSFKVTNTGNVALNPVTVSDPKVGSITCPAGTLAPGAAVSCTDKSYTLTQTDVDAGKVDNTATATGTPPSGSPVTGKDSTSTIVPALPGIAIDKVASAVVSGKITYTFKVTNTGNVTLGEVAVSDPMFTGIACSPSTLAPGASVSCTSKVYTLTQADTDRGSVQNTATATGTAPSGTRVTDTDSTTTALPGSPAIELDKVAGPLTGGTITYTFKVTNVGTVTLSSVALTDPLLGGAISCASTTLAPSASTTCTATTYPLTQHDVDAGTVQNTATATGTAPGGARVTDTDSTTTPVPQNPAISLDKVAGPLADGRIGYTFSVTNTGNVTLDPITLDDQKLGGAIGCPTGKLAPGATVSCTATTYTLKQSDVDAGTVDNTATVTGTAPGGTQVTDTDSTSTPVPSAPAIHLDKTAGAITDGKIAYTFVVTNTGNVTLDPVKVTDAKVGAVTCPSGRLAPNDSVTCTAAPYVVTQADTDAGKVDNTATASGTPPTGSPVTDTDSTTTPIAQHASIDLVKSAGNVYDVNGNGLDDGDTVTYTFRVTNTGNVTLSGVNVSDPKVGPVSCPTAPLAPGAAVDCDPRTYPLTQADIDSGSVVNHATVTGISPAGETVTDDDTRTVDLPATGAIQLVKSAGDLVDTDGNGPDAGDTITYSFTVTNVGNVNLDPISVSDPKVGGVTCPTGGLEPDESFDCTPVVYTVTAADASAGKVVNTATATGRTPTGGSVQDTDSTTTTVQQNLTNIKVRKTASDAAPHVGDTITYTLTVTNTGAADAKAVLITDALPTGVTFVSADAACTRTGSVVRCDVGNLPTDASRDFQVRVKIDPLPAMGADHQHLFDVQKTEVQTDMQAGQTVTGTASCMAGYDVTDGSGRVDHVDQGTGSLADVHMTANRAVGNGGWTATFVNDTTGHSTGKVFAVCVKQGSEVVDNHSHSLVVGSQLTRTVPLTTGINDAALSCAAGQTPVQPGYQLDGVAPIVTTYPDDSFGWHFRVITDSASTATSATFTLRCLDNLVSTANGHTHALDLDEVRKSVTIQPGQNVEVQLICDNDAKGIVAGYDVDPGLVVLGNDPRPIVRAFQLFNPSNGPLDADLYLMCLGNRTAKGADQGSIVNTATATTSTPETSSGDNSSSVTIHVSPAATPVAPTVTVSSARVATTIQCGSGSGTCSGTAKLEAQGTVLAKGSYQVKAGKKATLHLKKTKAGKRMLAKGLKKAKLKIDGKTRTVRIKH